jgi:hypothetical protein
MPWHGTYLLIVTALGEGGTGLFLIVWPPAPFALLLGVEQPSPEAVACARVAGAALVGIGVSCWLGRLDRGSPARLGLFTGLLTYDVAVALFLAYAGLFMNLLGIALWPAVGLHAVLAVWCVVALRSKPRPGNLLAGRDA